MQPVFIDSERLSWNLDPALVIETIERKVREGKRPKAVIPVHLYGQSADLDPILEVCARYDIPVIEAAETLGATYKGRSPGTFGLAGIFSFDGNKIITTSGGGMLVSADKALIEHARKLSTQARDPAPHYQHSEIGYNYRLSNVLAAIGRGQLRVLEQRAQRKREIFAFYRDALAGACPPGPQFWGRRIYFPQDWGGGGPAGRQDIEARPVWKPPPYPPKSGGTRSSSPQDWGLGGRGPPGGWAVSPPGPGHDRRGAGGSAGGGASAPFNPPPDSALDLPSPSRHALPLNQPPPSPTPAHPIIRRTATLPGAIPLRPLRPLR